MNRAFIVTLDLEPTDDLNLIAAELHDSISFDFIELIDVKPWSPHDSGPTPPISPSPF